MIYRKRLLLAILVTLLMPAAHADFSGKAVAVTDGDTVKVLEEREVIVIDQDGVGTNIDGEQRGEHAHPIHDPLSAMFEALAGVMVNPAMIGATRAAVSDVVIRLTRRINQRFPGSRRRSIP